MGYSNCELTEKNLYERVSKLLESFEWSDCSFYVCGKPFKAHKLILGISSPVFRAMFYGPLANTINIEIPDIEPEIFQLLINYIYTDKIDIENIEQAFELLYASKKYMLEYLAENCIDYIKCNINIDNAVSILNYSDYVHEQSLLDYSLNFFSEYAKYILQENLEGLSCSSLQRILNCDKMNITERELIQSVFEWTKYYCKLYKDTNSKQNRREILFNANLFRQLRFLCLDELDLDSIVSEENNLLLPIEEMVIRVNITGDLKKINEKCFINSLICTSKRPRDKLKGKSLLYHRSILRSATPLHVDNLNNIVNVRLKANRTVLVSSLRIPTRMSPHINFCSKTNDLSYSEELTVSVIREIDNHIMKTVNFITTSEFDSNMMIQFSEPVVLKNDFWYVISFLWPDHNSFSYKYIMSHRSNISTQLLVQFSFDDINLNGSFLESLICI